MKTYISFIIFSACSISILHAATHRDFTDFKTALYSNDDGQMIAIYENTLKPDTKRPQWAQMARDEFRHARGMELENFIAARRAPAPVRAPVAPPAAPIIPARPVVPEVPAVEPIVPEAPAVSEVPEAPAGAPSIYVPRRPVVTETELEEARRVREERERDRAEKERKYDAEIVVAGPEIPSAPLPVIPAPEPILEEEEEFEIPVAPGAPGMYAPGGGARLGESELQAEIERRRLAKEKAERDKKYIEHPGGFVFEAPEEEMIVTGIEAPVAPPIGKRVYEQRIQDDIKEVYAKINDADAELRKIPLEKAEIAQAYNKQTDAENLRDRIQNQLDPDDLAALNVQIRKLQRRIEMAKTKIDVQQDKIGAIKSIEDDIGQGVYQITPRYGMSANIKKAMKYYLKAQQSLAALVDTLVALGDPLDASLFKKLNNDLIELKASIYAEQANRPASLEAIIEQYPELQSELHKIEKELSATVADIGWPNQKNKKWLNDPKKRQAIVSKILNMQFMLNNIVEMRILSTEDQQIIQQKINKFAQAIAADLFNEIQPLSDNLQQGTASDKGRQNFIQLFENISTLMRSGVRLDNYQNKFDNIQKQYDILTQGIPSAPPLTPEEARKYAASGGGVITPGDVYRQGNILQPVREEEIIFGEDAPVAPVMSMSNGLKAITETIDEIKDQLVTYRTNRMTESSAHKRIRQLIDQAKAQLSDIPHYATRQNTADILSKLETALNVRINRNKKLTQEELNQILEHGAAAPDMSSNINIPAAPSAPSFSEQLSSPVKENYNDLMVLLRQARSTPPHNIPDDLRTKVKNAIENNNNDITDSQKDTLAGFIGYQR